MTSLIFEQVIKTVWLWHSNRMLTEVKSEFLTSIKLLEIFYSYVSFLFLWVAWVKIGACFIVKLFIQYVLIKVFVALILEKGEIQLH